MDILIVYLEGTNKYLNLGHGDHVVQAAFVHLGTTCDWLIVE